METLTILWSLAHKTPATTSSPIYSYANNGALNSGLEGPHFEVCVDRGAGRFYGLEEPLFSGKPDGLTVDPDGRYATFASLHSVTQ